MGGDEEGVEERGREGVCFLPFVKGEEGVSKEEVVEFDGLIFWRDGLKDGGSEEEVFGSFPAAEDEEELFGQGEREGSEFDG